MRARTSQLCTRDHAIHLLANGFPEPDFALIYGCHYSLHRRQGAYQSHIRRLINDYQNLVSFATNHATLIAFAILLLNDVAVAVVHDRPSGNLAEAQMIEIASERYQIVEKLIRSTDCPPALWMRAVYVFFGYICTLRTAEGIYFTTNVNDFEFAGWKWHQVRQKALTDVKTAISAASHNQLDIESARSDIDRAIEASNLTYNKVLTPIIHNRGETTVGSLYSGWVGRFGKSANVSVSSNENHVCSYLTYVAAINA
jgi:hypothetical protein